MDSRSSFPSRVWPLARRWWRRLRIPGILAFLSFSVWFYQALPDPLFHDPTSTVIEDREGQLLGAVIAEGEQWHFPKMEQVPERFQQALICFEDKRFYDHVGVDPLAVGRALVQNLKQGQVVSGASTLTMQVIRLSRKNPARTLSEKVLEALLAFRLELREDKAEIMCLYASHAPFGGNVVGLDAASWRYFGQSPQQMTWAEAAMLAVLPNNPSLIHPGRNRDLLLKKRNALLERLQQQGHFDTLTLQLAMAESLPDKPRPLPRLAPHLLARVQAEQADSSMGIRLKTSLDRAIQIQTTRILDRYHQRLVENGIHNGAALVLDNETGQVLAYVGNTGDFLSGTQGQAVDIIPARRSTGSTLKPMLYAAMIQDGKLLPDMLLPDIPTRFGSYAPKNFTGEYQGAVRADEALAQSINVPAARMLEDYGAVRFHHLLKKLGMNSLDQPASFYGLSLILGGAESSVWELAGIYSSMARTLLHYQDSGNYYNDDFRPPSFTFPTPSPERTSRRPRNLSASAIWQTFQALTKVNRPEAQGLWQYFDSARKISWKTGTSFGFRDAWSLGCTPKYTVAVWIGNADGKGRPGLTGVSTAAPVMFEIFRSLNPEPTWFSRPEREMVQLEICQESGYRAGEICPNRERITVPKSSLRAETCAFHQLVHLDATGQFRVHSDCYSPSAMKHLAWFVLPPGMEWHYRQTHADYRPLPEWAQDCLSGLAENKENLAMELIYPSAHSRLLIPVELDGTLGNAVFKAAHRQENKIIHWHLDNNYLGQTRTFHSMAIHPKAGPHLLVLVDEDGARLERKFEVLEEKLGGG